MNKKDLIYENLAKKYYEKSINSLMRLLLIQGNIFVWLGAFIYFFGNEKIPSYTLMLLGSGILILPLMTKILKWKF